VLGGKAVGSYLGKVAVARDAQQTDSIQSVKAMLLDRGATVGELDKNQLFYAAARGLDPASARALLLEGVVGGLWDDIDGDDQGIASQARAALKRVA
jgi:Fe-S cluster assembly protein SufD